KARLLMEQNMGQLVGKGLSVLWGGEVTVFAAPPRDCIDHPPDHLAHAVLALRRVERTAKILGNHHLGGHQRPRFGDFDVVLFEDDLALLVDNGSIAQLPVNFVVRAHPCAAEIARYFKPGFYPCRSLLRGAEIARLRSTRRHVSYSFPMLKFPIYGVVQSGMH